MRPPRRLEAPACRTGSSPQNDTLHGQVDAAAEAPGGAGVPTRVLTPERHPPWPGRCGRRGAWRRRRADPGPHPRTTPSMARSMRPPRRLEAPACRTGSSPQNDTLHGQVDAAAEAPGGAGVPNGSPPQNDTRPCQIDAAAEAPGGAGVPNRVLTPRTTRSRDGIPPRSTAPLTGGPDRVIMHSGDWVVARRRTTTVGGTCRHPHRSATTARPASTTR